MAPLASTLLFGGAALFIAVLVSPATSAPNAMPAAVASPVDQLWPALTEVNAQVDRLKERLATVPVYPPPGRDPFRFGGRPIETAPSPPPAPAPVVLEPAPVLPRLVAVLSTAVDGGVLRTAVFAAGDDVQIVKPGDRIGNYLVRAISFDAVTLVDRTSAAAFRVQ
jgi:hypothetical protein